MSDYADLIERLEKAAGPDRELDFVIATAVHGPMVRQSSLHLPYTASIDAALTLVPGSHDWSLFGDNGEAIAGCMPASEDGCDLTDCHGATPALALCIAALKARAALTQREGGGA